MPELPEVETVRLGLQPYVAGATITAVELNRADLRFPFPAGFAERLRGRRIGSMSRRAKYLLFHLDEDAILVSHLGMSGSYRFENTERSEIPGEFHRERSKNEAHDHVFFDLACTSGDFARLIYNDPRRFGFMLLIGEAELASHRAFAGLGVEPTSNRLDGHLIARLFAGRKAPLKAALMDQRNIAGLGNIYACEAMWRAGVDPRRPAGSIAGSNGKASVESDRLASAIRDVIAEAIAAGGSSLRDYIHADGSLGYFQHRFSVYDREGHRCTRAGCDGTIIRIVQSGRSTFYCPDCQS